MADSIDNSTPTADATTHAALAFQAVLYRARDNHADEHEIEAQFKARGLEGDRLTRANQAATKVRELADTDRTKATALATATADELARAAVTGGQRELSREDIRSRVVTRSRQRGALVTIKAHGAKRPRVSRTLPPKQ